MKILLIALLFIASVSSIQWAGSVNGTWSQANLWAGGAIPTTDVEINTAGTFVVTIASSASISGIITLGGPGSTPILIVGANFDVGGSINMLGGKIQVQASAILNVNGIVISATTPCDISIDFDGEIRTTLFTANSPVSLGGFLGGYGKLTVSGAFTVATGINFPIVLTYVTIGATGSLSTTGTAVIELLGFLKFLGTTTTNANIVWGRESSLTVDTGKTVTFTSPFAINPTTGNTVIMNGNIIANENVTLSTGSITLQSGIFTANKFISFMTGTQFNSDAGASIAIGNGGGIFSTTNVGIYSAVATDGSVTFEIPTGFLSITGNLAVRTGTLTVRGLLVIAATLTIMGNSQMNIPVSTSKVTFNEGAQLALSGTNAAPVLGAGNLIFILGSTFTVSNTVSIANPTVLSCAVNVQSGKSITFNGVNSVTNGTSFNGVGGNDAWVYLKGTFDFQNDGNVVTTHKTIINACNVVVSQGSIIYFASGVMDIQTFGKFWVNGTLYTTFATPIAIDGTGQINVLPVGVWWVGTTVTCAATFNLQGMLRMNSGKLILTRDGYCNGTVSFYGDIEIAGSWNVGLCRPSGNGTLTFNSPTQTTHLLPAGNYSIGYLRVMGASTLNTVSGQPSGFNLVKGDVYVQGTGTLVINSNSGVKGNIFVTESGALKLTGTTTTLRAQSIAFNGNTNYLVDANLASSGQITVIDNAKLGGTCRISITGNDILQSIALINYGTRTSSFATLTVAKTNVNDLTQYAPRYDTKRVVAVVSTTTTSTSTGDDSIFTSGVGNTGETTETSASTSTAGNPDDTENSANSIQFSAVIVSAILSILFMF